MMDRISLYMCNGVLKFKVKQQLSTTSSSFASIKQNSCSQAPEEAAVDSAASNNYFPITYIGEEPRTSHNTETVGTANGALMRLVATDRFTMVGVPKEARECKKFAEITLPLVSVGRLCVHGMIVAFDDTSVYICNKDGTLISKGRRDPLRNLYMIPIEAPKLHNELGVDTPKATHTAPGVQETRKQNNKIIECRATARLNSKVAANAYEI